MNLYRRKSGARLAELEDLVEQLRLKLAKVEKEKVKLQVEIRDLSIEYETVSAALLDAAVVTRSKGAMGRCQVARWLSGRASNLRSKGRGFGRDAAAQQP